MRLLIIEDELRTADYLQQGLRENGYVVDCAHTGTDGLHASTRTTWSSSTSTCPSSMAGPCFSACVPNRPRAS